MKRPKPDPACGFCFGAWNGMDRWFMQECVCRKKCAEQRCKGGR